MIAQLVLLASLILLSGFFSGTETAPTSLSAVQIHRLEESGGRRGRLVSCRFLPPGSDAASGP